MTSEAFASQPASADLCMSLDVIYHLVEDDVFQGYMRDLFGSAKRYVLIYSSDGEDMLNGRHVRHRRYSDWVASNRPDFGLVREWQNPYAASLDTDWANTSFAHFKLFERIVEQRP